jgi:AraC family transcriptional regulator
VKLSKQELVFDGSMGHVRPLGPDPHLTSADLGWCGFLLEQHRLPSFESRDVIWMRNVVLLQQGPPVTVEIKDGTRYVSRRIMPGQVFLRPWKVRTSARCRETTEFVLVSLEPSFMGAACGGQVDTETFELSIQNGIDDRFVEGVCLALRDEVQRGGGSGRLYSESLAVSLAVHLASRYARQGGVSSRDGDQLPSRAVRRAMEYINDYLNQDLSLTRIAEAVGLSAFHFSRLFKRATGLSPHQYVVRQRVERARQLLMRSGLSLAEIALEVGFCDQSHLTLHFKRVCGTTPKVYLNQVFPARATAIEEE